MAPAAPRDLRALHLVIGVDNPVDSDGHRYRQLDARDCITAALKRLGIELLLTDDGTDVYLNWPAGTQPPSFDDLLSGLQEDITPADLEDARADLAAALAGHGDLTLAARPEGGNPA